MVHAINKEGREMYFTDRVWELMPKHKNGWIEFSSKGEVIVPQQILEFQQKKKEAVAVEDIKNDTPVVSETADTKVEIEPVKPVSKTKITKSKPVKKPRK